ncbi:MAG: alpha/beta hydrolase [Tyzzerella sp.]|nr:alpha/beta hydrolase [Tyzzerella sp.]
MLLYFIYKYAFGADEKRLADDTEIPNEEKYKDHVEEVHRNIQAIKDSVFEKWTITARDGTFVKLSAKIYGKFNLEGASATEALAKCKVPILLIHGEADELVPCEMSRVNYEACASEKELYTVAGAGHGLSYLTNVDAYMGKFRGFLRKHFA